MEMEIQTSAHACLLACRTCLQKAVLVQHPEQYLIETQLERFSSWTTNINVLAAYKASLDYRLRHTPAVGRLVRSILSVVQERLQGCLAPLFCTACSSNQGGCDRSQPSCGECVASNSVCSYVDAISHPSEEHTSAISRAFEAIAEEVTILHQLSNTIRKATRDVRNTEIDDKYILKGENMEEELKSMFADIVAREIRYARPQIQDRFVEAMMARRKRICYRQDQRESNRMASLDSTAPNTMQDPNAAKRVALSGTLSPKPEIRKTSIQPLTANKTSLMLPRFPHVADSGGSQIRTASSMVSQQFLRASSPSQASSNSGRTVAQDSLRALSFPPRPRMYNRDKYKILRLGITKSYRDRIKEIQMTEEMCLRNGIFKRGLEFKNSRGIESARFREERKKAKKQCGWGQGSFTCPLCLSLLEKKSFDNERRWRSHVLHDIQACICISEGCPTPSKMYTKGNDWLAHMEHHFIKWHCDANTHRALEFDTEDAYRLHMSEEHAGTFSERQIQALAKTNAWADDPLYDRCPLCQPESITEPLKEPAEEPVKVIKGPVEEHIIGHLRKLALTSLPADDEAGSMSTWDSSGAGTVRTEKTRETIRQGRINMDKPIFDDLAPDSPIRTSRVDPYADWNGYDSFIATFPETAEETQSRSTRAPLWQIFPFPPEPKWEENSDRKVEYSYWPVDPSIEFVRYPIPQKNVRESEWGWILAGDSVSAEDIGDQLRKEMSRHKIGLDGDNEYLPEAAIDILITKATIQVTLDEPADETFIDYIFHSARKLFALTALTFPEIQLRHYAMKVFHKHYTTDLDLPIKDRQSKPLNPRSQTGAFQNNIWSQTSFEIFFKYQWSFCVPKFDSQTFLFDFQPQMILPVRGHLREHISSGYFSDLDRVQILQSYQTVLGPEIASFDDQGEPWVDVALKTFKANEGGWPEALWRGEAEAAEAILDIHPQLLRGVAAFHQGDKLCMVYEWASGGNLREFWQRNPSPELSRDIIFTFLVQIQGLLEALACVHNSTERKLSPSRNVHAMGPEPFPEYDSPAYGSRSKLVIASDPTEYQRRVGKSAAISDKHEDIKPQNIPAFERYEEVRRLRRTPRHGDIRPEKILVFLADGKVRALKLGSVGTSKPLGLYTSTNEPEETRQTRIYQPPVANSPQTPHSRREDVWSIGCVIYETILWLLYGVDVVDQFLAISQGQPHSTPYWTESHNPHQLSVSRGFLDWTSHILSDDPECNMRSGSAMADLIMLVRDECLVVDLHARATASRFCQRMRTIVNRSREDKRYCFTGASRADVSTPYEALKASIYNKSDITLKTMGPNDNTLLDLPTSLRTRETNETRNDPTLRSYIGTVPWTADWTAEVSDEFVLHVAQLSEIEELKLFEPTAPAALCKACSALHFSTMHELFIRCVQDLSEESKHGCQLCTLLHAMALNADFKPHETVEFGRSRTGISLTHGTRTFSDTLRLSTNPATINHRNGIPTGFPQVVEAGSAAHLTIVSECLQDCLMNHAKCITRQEPVALPRRLVDTVGMGSAHCYLVETSALQSDVQYAALSHPWGDPRAGGRFVCHENTLAELREGFNADDLPATLRDAIHIVRSLGMRYLWVDALCVVFDLREELETDVANMADVFGGAQFVIAATSAESMASGILQPRQRSKYTAVSTRQDSDEEFLVYVSNIVNDFEGEVLQAPLHSRAWALQERALARRTIFFAKKQTYFECGEGIRCETLAKLQSEKQKLLGDPNFPQFALQVGETTAIDLFKSLYESYSGMGLSIPIDRPVAIAGLEQRLATAFETHSMFGVFQKYWGQCLLWRKQADSDLTPIDFHPSISVPSWSWMAYQGRIEYIKTPLHQMVWNTKIHLPFVHPSIQITREAGECLLLKPLAFRFLAKNLQTPLYLDQSTHPVTEDMRCAVVGTHVEQVDKTDENTYYVLLLSRTPQLRLLISDSSQRWKRIGVAVLRGFQIDFESSIMVDVE